jgi:restriction system protein
VQQRSLGRWHIGDVQAMTDREFQAVVAALFRWLGYAVVRTPLSRDSGMDLVLAGHEGKAIVQCKRWRHPVGPAVVREFFGTMVSEEAAQGYLITTGIFSKDARRWARDKDIVLVDGPFLKKLMADI